MGKEKSISIPTKIFKWYNDEYIKSTYPLDKKKTELFKIISKLDEQLDSRLIYGDLRGSILDEDLSRLILNGDLSKSFDLEAYALIIDKSPGGDIFKPKFDGIIIGNRYKKDKQDFYFDLFELANRRRSVINTLSLHFCYIFNKSQEVLFKNKSKDEKEGELRPKISYSLMHSEKPFTSSLDLILFDPSGEIIKSNIRDCVEIGADKSKPLLLPLGIHLNSNRYVLNGDFFPAYVAFLNKRFKEEVEIPSPF